MLVLLAACTGSPDHPHHPGDHGTSIPTDPGSTLPETSWTAPTGTEPPEFDADALGNGLDATLVQALDFTAEPVLVSYDAVMKFAGGYCPYMYGYDYGNGYSSSWYGQCSSGVGATFSGYVSDYTENTYRGLYASATVLTPGGYQLTGAGYWASEVDYYGQDRYSYQYLDGPFQFDGAEAEGTWIQDQVQPHELTLSRGDGGDGRWHTVDIDGQYTGATGPVDTVDFQGVSFDSRDDCAEPSGGISLRTPSADWFDVTFGGKGTDACDGCGTARWRGLELGEVCGDFTPWMEGGQ